MSVGVVVLYYSGAVKTSNTFRNEEHTNTQFAYGLRNANCRAAVVEFHCYPHCETLETTHRVLRENDSFPWVNAECEESQYGEINVLAAVQRSPSASMQRISWMTGVAQTQVWGIMHHNNFYLCHLQRVQHLLTGIKTTMTICEGLQTWPQILPNIPVTNEGPFTGDAIPNTINLYSLAQENPHHETQCHFQWSSVNMWCGVLDTNLIRPCVIKLRVTALYYRDCLENELS